MRKNFYAKRMVAMVLTIAMLLGTFATGTLTTAQAATQAKVTKVSSVKAVETLREGQILTKDMLTVKVKKTNGKTAKTSSYTSAQIGKTIKPIASGKNKGKFKVTVKAASKKKTVYLKVNLLKKLATVTTLSLKEGAKFSESTFRKKTVVTGVYTKGKMMALTTYTVTVPSKKVTANNKGNFVVTVKYGKLTIKVNVPVKTVNEPTPTPEPVKKHTVSVSVGNADNSVQVTLDGKTVNSAEVEEGTTVKVAATSNEDYEFSRWIDAATGVTLSEATEYSFKVTSNVSLIAVYQKLIKNYAVTVVTAGGNGTIIIDGSVSNNAIVPEGTNVSLVAAPATGYKFVNWKTGDGKTVLGTSSTYILTVSQNETVIANFEAVTVKPDDPEKYTVTAAPRGEGTVKINGQITTSKEFEVGENVSLSATPTTASRFVNWTDINGNELSSSATYSFSIKANTVVFANFELIPANYTVSTVVKGSGSVTINNNAVNSKQFTSGTTVSVVATPAKGCKFANWTDISGNVLGTFTTYSFVISANTVVVANFEQIPAQEFTVSTKTVGNGTATVEGLATKTVEEGETVTLVVVPASGSKFVCWKDINGNEVSKENPYTFKVSKDILLIAHFETIPVAPTEYTVTTVCNGDGTATVDGATSKTVATGAEVTATATATAGNTFVAWKDSNGATISTTNPYTFEVSDNILLVATFEAETVSVNVGNNYTNMGTVTVNGTAMVGDTLNTSVVKGSQVVLTANPLSSDYEFVRWASGTKVLSTSATYSFKPDGDVTVTAVFQRLHTINITKIGNGTVALDGTGLAFTNAGVATKKVPAGTYTVVADPQTGYDFSGWRNAAGRLVSSTTNYTIPVNAADTSDINLTVEFTEQATTVAVKFIHEDNSQIDTKTVTKGQAPASWPTVNVYRGDRTFAGWELEGNLYAPVTAGDYQAAEFYFGTTPLSTAIATLTANGDVTITAKYSDPVIPNYDITLTNGTFLKPTNVAGQSSANLPMGTEVQIKVNDGFYSWEDASGQAVGDATYTFYVSSDAQFVASTKVFSSPLFKVNTYSVDKTNYAMTFSLDCKLPAGYRKTGWKMLYTYKTNGELVNGGADVFYSEDINDFATEQDVSNYRYHVAMGNSYQNAPLRFRFVCFYETATEPNGVIYTDYVNDTFK